MEGNVVFEEDDNASSSKGAVISNGYEIWKRCLTIRGKFGLEEDYNVVVMRDLKEVTFALEK